MSAEEGHRVFLEGHNVAGGVWCCISEIWSQKVMGRAPISQEPFKGPPFSVFSQTQPPRISTGWRAFTLDTKGPVFEDGFHGRALDRPGPRVPPGKTHLR